MNEKAITTMTEDEILAHIALQRQQREARHAEAVAAREKKTPAAKKLVRDTLDNAFDELLKTMLTPLPPAEEKP